MSPHEADARREVLWARLSKYRTYKALAESLGDRELKNLAVEKENEVASEMEEEFGLITGKWEHSEED